MIWFNRSHVKLPWIKIIWTKLHVMCQIFFLKTHHAVKALCRQRLPRLHLVKHSFATPLPPTPPVDTRYHPGLQFSRCKHYFAVISLYAYYQMRMRFLYDAIWLLTGSGWMRTKADWIGQLMVTSEMSFLARKNSAASTTHSRLWKLPLTRRNKLIYEWIQRTK